MGTRTYESEPLPNFAGMSDAELEQGAVRLKATVDNPEVAPEDKLDTERLLGHAAFELWYRRRKK